MKAFLQKIILVILMAISWNSLATTRYVNQANQTPILPFDSWLTAATNIQDAIDAAVAGDLILVTNGIYATGGRVVFTELTNRVAITKPVTVQSVNGPLVTIIQGFQVPGITNGPGAVRCVYATEGAVMSGFTLTNGATLSMGTGEDRGGGILCAAATAIVSNCVLTGNSSGYMGGAISSGTLWSSIVSHNVSVYAGGGAIGTKMFDCLLFGNSAQGGGGAVLGELNRCIVSNNIALYGGGVSDAFVNQSIVVSNSALRGGGGYQASFLNSVVIGNSAIEWGGGTDGCSVLNSIVYYNSAPANTNFSGGDHYLHSCTTPIPPDSSGCFSDAPLFVDLAANNFQLLSNSPCINSGKDVANLFATNSTDFANLPRVVGGMVDVGIYEFQNPASALSYAWAKQYGLPYDGTADFGDLDGDGMSNYAEWRADTLPNDTNSVLRLLTVSHHVNGLEVNWQSSPTRTYAIERSTNLISPASFEFINLINGSSGVSTYLDDTATNGGPYFYRVRIQ